MRWLANKWIPALGLGLLLCLPQDLSAQAAKKKKPKAPPKKMTIPADSLQQPTGQEKQKKAPAAPQPDERLQLPEVLIYGKDASRRVAGKKITISPDRPELVTPEAMYEPLNVEELQKGQREEPTPADEQKNRQVELMAFGGQFDQFGAQARYWQRLSGKDFGVDLQYARTYGQYVNSTKELGHLQAQFGLMASEHTEWRFTGVLTKGRWGLYGAAEPQTDRDNTGVGLGVRANYQPESDFTADLSLDIDFQSFADKLADTTRFEADLFQFRAGAKIQKSFESSDVSLEFTSLSDRWTAQPGEQSRSWQRYRAVWGAMPWRWLSVQIAPGVTVARQDSVRESRFSPQVKAVLSLKKSMVATAQFQKGWMYIPWDERLASNGYLSLNTINTIQDVRWAFSSELNWAVGKSTVLRAMLERKRVHGLLYFERDSLGTFTANTLDAELGRFAIGLDVQLSSQFSLSVTWNALDDRVRSGDRFLAVLDIPYRPELEVPVMLTYRPNDAWQIDVQALWVGARKVKLARTETLPAYVDVGTQVRWRFGGHTSIFVQIKNLLDENYAVWQGYRELGLHLMAGLQAKW